MHHQREAAGGAGWELRTGIVSGPQPWSVLPGVEDAPKAGTRTALRGCGITRPTELLDPRFPEFTTSLPRQQWEGLSFLALPSRSGKSPLL